MGIVYQGGNQLIHISARRQPSPPEGQKKYNFETRTVAGILQREYWKSGHTEIR